MAFSNMSSVQKITCCLRDCRQKSCGSTRPPTISCDTPFSTTRRGSKKPDATVLKAILADLNVPEEECIYVGDSLFKDVAMAQDAGVEDVWARYGQAQSRPEYDLLREVTHWSDADVQRERLVRGRDVNPRHTLTNSFAELLTQFEFGDSRAR
jgi:hypothetical protein